MRCRTRTLFWLWSSSVVFVSRNYNWGRGVHGGFTKSYTVATGMSPGLDRQRCGPWFCFIRRGGKVRRKLVSASRTLFENAELIDLSANRSIVTGVILPGCLMRTQPAARALAQVLGPGTVLKLYSVFAIISCSVETNCNFPKTKINTKQKNYVLS